MSLQPRRFLFLFIDGLGLGSNDPEVNPLARTSMPCIQMLLNGGKLVADNSPFENNRCSLIGIDACLGVEGMPQSATGQAVLLTGRNVPKEIGYHYGPKPNQEISEIVSNGNLFSRLSRAGKEATLVNAYPQRYFDAISKGRRLYSSIPLAVTSAGLNLKTTSDLFYGMAMSADFTGKSWREHLGMKDTPLLSPFEAGKRLARLSRMNDFTFFDYWMSDYAGHSQEMPFASSLLEEIDGVICGLLSVWNDQEGIIFITSDHGNMEDLSTHRHTFNQVPALVIGSQELRQAFTQNLTNLVDVTPAILNFFEVQ